MISSIYRDPFEWLPEPKSCFISPFLYHGGHREDANTRLCIINAFAQMGMTDPFVVKSPYRINPFQTFIECSTVIVPAHRV